MKDATTIAGELRTEALRLEQLVDRYRHAAAVLEGHYDEPAREIPAPMLREQVAKIRAKRRAKRVPAQAPVDTGPVTEPATEAPVEAKYGFKADGTPRKKPTPSPAHQAAAAEGRRRAHEARKAAREATARAAEGPAMGPRPKRAGISLRVLSSTHPTEEELKDREVVHTTNEPAA